jgi:alanine racemase
MIEPFVEVNINAIQHNISLFRKHVGRARILAVVKGNAYGHGLAGLSPRIEPFVDYFAVNSEGEGKVLREHNVTAPILVLSPYVHEPVVIKYGLTPTIQSIEALKSLHQAVKQAGLSSFPFHLKVNTGMNRFGIAMEDVVPFLEIYENEVRKDLRLVGVYSHTGCRKNNDGKMVETQIARFATVKKTIESRYQGREDQILFHFANTSVTIDYADSHFDMVRVGNGLFGQSYSVASWRLKGAGAAFAPVLEIKELKKGERIGYYSSYVAKKNQKVAILPFGQHEGLGARWETLPKDMKQTLYAIGRSLYRYVKPEPYLAYKGTVLSIIGKPTMHYLFVDVTEHAAIKVGDLIRISQNVISINESLPRVYKANTA